MEHTLKQNKAELVRWLTHHKFEDLIHTVAEAWNLAHWY